MLQKLVIGAFGVSNSCFLYFIFSFLFLWFYGLKKAAPVLPKVAVRTYIHFTLSGPGSAFIITKAIFSLCLCFCIGLLFRGALLFRKLHLLPFVIIRIRIRVGVRFLFLPLIGHHEYSASRSQHAGEEDESKDIRQL